jgi:hypothetical protein
MTAGVTGLGAKLKQGNGASPEVFTEIAEPKDISFGESVEFVDMTHQSSVGGIRERRPSLIDPGQATMRCNFLNETTQALLHTDMYARARRNYQIYLPISGLTYTFAGYVASLKRTAPMGGPLEMDIAIQIDGNVYKSA